MFNLNTFAARFRKALAVLAVVAATPGVLGVLVWAGLDIPANVFATLVTIMGVLAAPVTVAWVPNKLSPSDLIKAAAARGLGLIPDPKSAED